MSTHGLGVRVAGLAAVVAVAGAAFAVLVVSDGSGAESVLTATGGSVTGADTGRRAAESPRGLAAAPGRVDDRARVDSAKSEGRDGAVAVAQQARRRGLPRAHARLVTVREPALQNMTFSGRYQSEADATGSLRRARAATKGARVQRVAP